MSTFASRDDITGLKRAHSSINPTLAVRSRSLLYSLQQSLASKTKSFRSVLAPRAKYPKQHVHCAPHPLRKVIRSQHYWARFHAQRTETLASTSKQARQVLKRGLPAVVNASVLRSPASEYLLPGTHLLPRGHPRTFSHETTAAPTRRSSARYSQGPLLPQPTASYRRRITPDPERAAVTLVLLPTEELGSS